MFTNQWAINPSLNISLEEIPRVVLARRRCLEACERSERKPLQGYVRLRFNNIVSSLLLKHGSPVRLYSQRWMILYSPLRLTQRPLESSPE